MSNRETAAYGLAQMLASDPEMGTRLKAWMDANPDAIDRRKQRKLLRDLEAAEAMWRAESEAVGSGLPEREVAFDGDKAIDGEIACNVETDGALGPTCEVVFGQARTYGKPTPDADGAGAGVALMHRHGWMLWCAVLAWFEMVSCFAAMAVLGMAVALILLAHFVLLVAERNRDAAAHVAGERRGPGPMHGDAWALRGSRVDPVWQLIVTIAAFARGPPALPLLRM